MTTTETGRVPLPVPSSTSPSRSVAVVVGGGGALGRGCAVALAARGMAVVVTGPTERTLDATVAEIIEAGGDAQAVAADASQEPDVARVFDACYERFGMCDVLIHAAAIQGPTAPLTDISLDQWKSVIAVNLHSVFLTTRAALRDMVPAERGSIVLVSSADALRGFPMTGPYAASKSALAGFARALSAEVSGSGVRVNVLSPGPMPEAAIYQTAIGGIAGQLGIAPEEVLAAVTGAEGGQRDFSARDAAQGAVFLATSDSRFMTGQSLVMDSIFAPS